MRSKLSTFVNFRLKSLDLANFAAEKSKLQYSYQTPTFSVNKPQVMVVCTCLALCVYAYRWSTSDLQLVRCVQSLRYTLRGALHCLREASLLRGVASFQRHQVSAPDKRLNPYLSVCSTLRDRV